MPHLHKNTRFLDKSFSEQNTRNYVMSAMLDLHGLIVGIYDPEKNKIIGLVKHHFKNLETDEEITDELQATLNEISWLNLPFSKVCMLYRNNLSTLIPLPLFDRKKAGLYLEFNQDYPNEKRIVFDNVKHTDAVNVYGLPNKLVEKVKTTWPNVLQKHVSTCLIENLHVLAKNKDDRNILFLNVAEKSFDLVYFKENKLHFYNQFPFHTKTDFIYFLLASIEQLELNPESVSLLLLGKIDKNHENYEILYRYIRNIDFVDRNDNFSYSYVLDELKPHEHFVLFNSLQCE